MKKIIILSIMISLAVACDLNKFPADHIEKAQSFLTVDDATQFNNAMYVHLRNRIYGIYMFSEDVQADLYNASIDFGNNNGPVYRWSFVASDYTFRDTWRYYYAAIANINNFLDNVDGIQTSAEKDANTLKLYKGEAHLLRAFYYFQLTKKFCKDYEPATASSTMGLPLVTKFDITEKPSRSSLEDTYTLITDDLKEAKTLLVTEGKLGAATLTKDCVAALEARVYLAMHKYTDAANAADALIAGGKYPLVNTKDIFKEMWHIDKTDETILQLVASKPNELPTAINSIFLGYSTATNKYSPNFIPQQWIVDLYDNADIRREAYLEKKLINIVATDYTDVYAFNKYPGNPDLFTTNFTNYQHMPKVFRIAEMYLIKAEALYMASDEPGALSALNVLRTNRGLTTLAGLFGDALMTEIKNERVRELIGEGVRLDDLKRWGDDCIRKTPQELAIVTKGEDDHELIKRAGEDKFVWAIPDNDIRSNPNLKNQQNPGY